MSRGHLTDVVPILYGNASCRCSPAGSFSADTEVCRGQIRAFNGECWRAKDSSALGRRNDEQRVCCVKKGRSGANGGDRGTKGSALPQGSVTSVRTVTSGRFYSRAHRLGHSWYATEKLTVLPPPSLCWDPSFSLHMKDGGNASGFFGKNGHVGSCSELVEGRI